MTTVFWLSLLWAFVNSGSVRRSDHGTPAFVPSRSNLTYVIPVQSNGKFKSIVPLIMKNRSDYTGPVSRPHATPQLSKGLNQREQVVLVPVLVDLRMLQAMSVQSYGLGSSVNGRTGGMRDAVFCFTAAGTEMCVRTNLAAGRVTAQARRLRDTRGRRTKLRSRKKRRRHRKAHRSWKDALMETFGPRKRDTEKNYTIPQFLKKTMDVLISRNLTHWRKVRWESVVNSTGLDTDATVYGKLKEALQQPPEKVVTAQAVNDIFLLQELLDHANWTTDKKWEALKKGCQLLVTKETNAALPLVGIENTGDSWSYAGHGEVPVGSRKYVIKQYVVDSKEMLVLLENIRMFGASSKRPLLFAETASLSTAESEFGWQLLTLGFKMLRNQTHITEEQMKNVVHKLPVSAHSIKMQEVLNLMIIQDLVALNGSIDYEKWMVMELQRFTIAAVPIVSRDVQAWLVADHSQTLMDTWYSMQLEQLIMLKLTMLGLNASYETEIEKLLSGKLDVGVTSDSLKTLKKFLSENHVSNDNLRYAYLNEMLPNATMSSLLYVNNSNGSGTVRGEHLQTLSIKDANNTEALTKKVDAVTGKMKGMNDTNIENMCAKELFFLMLLTMGQKEEPEEILKDIIIMKWSNLTEVEAATRLTLSPQTVKLLSGFIHMGQLSIVEFLLGQIEVLGLKQIIDNKAEVEKRMRNKLLEVLKRASPDMSVVEDNSDSFGEGTGAAGSAARQMVVPGKGAIADTVTEKTSQRATT